MPTKKSDKANKIIVTSHDPIRLSKELEEFDHVRWAIACRHMQIRLLHGDIEHAKQVLEAFYRSRCKVKATLLSHVSSVFEVRIADLLEGAKLCTLAQVDEASNDFMVKLGSLGAGSLGVIRKTIAAVKAGQVYEDWATSEIEEIIGDPELMPGIAQTLKSEASDIAQRRALIQKVRSA